jgi:hypothetical protein
MERRMAGGNQVLQPAWQRNRSACASGGLTGEIEGAEVDVAVAKLALGDPDELGGE